MTDHKMHTDLVRKSKKLKRSEKRTWLKPALVVLMVLFLFASGIVIYAVLIANKSLEKTHVAINETELRPETEGTDDIIEREEPISVLLMGVDAKVNEGRADVLMLFTINPHTGDSKLVSIPRDTQVELAGYESTATTKINSAYMHGSEEMTVRTVEQFLNVPIDFFVTTNFTGFTKLIDAFGGVTVDNAFAFDADQFHFEQGPITLNGEEALAYCRMRKQDPEGDFGRQKRQRQVLAALKDKAKSPEVLFQFQDVLEVVGDDVRTNLTVEQMIGLQRTYLDCLDHTEVLDLNATGETIEGVSMQVVAEEDRERVSNAMRAHLELDQATSSEPAVNQSGVTGNADSNTTGVTNDSNVSNLEEQAVAEQPSSSGNQESKTTE